MHCSLLDIISNSIFTCIVIALFITILSACCSALFRDRLNQQKLPNRVVFLLIIFFLSSIYIGYYPLIRWKDYDCIHLNTPKWNRFYHISMPIWHIFRIIQCFILSMLFEISLVKIFKNTSFAITNRVQITYKMVFNITGCCIVSLLFTIIVFHPSLIFQIRFIAQILLLLYLTIMTSLCVLCMSKLVIVYKVTYDPGYDVKENTNNKDLVDQITKLTILISISMTTTILLLISQIIREFGMMPQKEIIMWLVQIMGVINGYTNFVNSIIIMDSIFSKDLYWKLCGKLDMKCRKCWMRILNIERKDIIRKNTKELKLEKQIKYSGMMGNIGFEPVPQVTPTTCTSPTLVDGFPIITTTPRFACKISVNSTTATVPRLNSNFTSTPIYSDAGLSTPMEMDDIEEEHVDVDDDEIDIENDEDDKMPEVEFVKNKIIKMERRRSTLSSVLNLDIEDLEMSMIDEDKA